ncbi:putative mini-chromosome maintenance complex-binding protein [Helianthus anomalus]
MIVTTFLNHPVVLRVPLLTHSTVKWVQANLLVRFRGVIQDMLGDECYVGAYKNEGTWNTNNSQMFLNFPSVILRIPASGIVGCSYVYLYVTISLKKEIQGEECRHCYRGPNRTLSVSVSFTHYGTAWINLKNCCL